MKAKHVCALAWRSGDRDHEPGSGNEGLGIRDWGLEADNRDSNHQTPIPNPQSPIPSSSCVVIVPRLLAQLLGLHGELQGTDFRVQAVEVSHPVTPSPPAPRPSPLLHPSTWQDTRVLIPDLGVPALRNQFTGEVLRLEGGSLSLASVLADFPVALLIG